MKKNKRAYISIVLLTVILLITGLLTSCSLLKKDTSSENQNAPMRGSLVEVKGGRITQNADKNSIYVTVDENTKKFDLVESVVFEGSLKWRVYTDEKKTTEVENVRSIPLKAGNNTVYLEITTDKGVKDYNFTINKKYYIELSFKIGRRWVETLKILSGDRVLDEDIPIPQKSARYKFNNWIWPNPSRIFHENTTIEADYEETKPHLVIWYLLEREKATADYTILDFEEYHFTNIPSSPYTVKLFDGDETDESFNRAQEVTVKTFEGYELNREESRFWAELDNYEASTWCVLYYDKVHS